MVVSVVIKSDMFTPNRVRGDGAYILSHFTQVQPANNNAEWRVHTDYTNAWQFIVILDNTWGFDPFQTSTTTLTVNTPIDTNNLGIDHILFGFTTNARNNEFVSLLIPIGQHSFHNVHDTNKIYPNCSHPIIDAGKKSGFAIGDIAGMPDYNKECDIANGNCNAWENMKPENPNSANTFPITITFENNPTTNTLYLSFNSMTSDMQTCSFWNLPTNEGLKIYFKGYKIYYGGSALFSVSAFEVSYSQTPLTARPTLLPTIKLTNKPTNMPSFNPIIIPTDMPIRNPTFNPIKNPTSHPIMNPTSNPAKSPSNMPTTRNVPTFSPTPLPKIPLKCGDIQNGFLATGNYNSVVYPVNIPYNLDRIIISTCHSFTDFDTMLTLFNDQKTIKIISDDNGCNDNVGRSQIILYDIKAGNYNLLLHTAENVKVTDIGLYQIAVSCTIPNTMLEFCSLFVPL